MTKTPFSETMERATDLLEIIHTDVCGPMNIEARGRYHYFLIFTDDLSRYEYIYLMKHKSETLEKFKDFQSEVENHRNKKIKFLRYDRGEEYLSYEFGLQLKQCEIVSLLTPPYFIRYGAIYDVSYRFTTIVLGLCIRDSYIHVKKGTI